MSKAASKRHPWMKFYVADWRADPRLRMCSLAARGLWMEMLCLMHEAEPRGSLLINGQKVVAKQLASLVGASANDVLRCLGELSGTAVFSTDPDGTIFSRRMRRDDEKAAADKANGEAGGHPEIRRGTVPKEQRVRRFRRSDAPAKAQRIFDRSSGACHWCKKMLDVDCYHIDHVIAVRDGGTNDEENLVASCPHCNGERAMRWGRSDADLMVGNDADPKAQILETREERKMQPAAALTADADLYRRGKEILGKEAGGLVKRLLKSKDGNIALARAAIEQASTKSDPREYIGAILRGAVQVQNSFLDPQAGIL